MKILVIQQKMIGDVLTSTIICEALKKEYPKATIDYLVNSSTKPVIQENPFFDHIIEFKNEYRDSKKEFYSFLKEIKKTKYDLVIDAYGKLESNLISYFSKAPKKVSFYKWYTRFLYPKVIYRKAAPITNASIAIENRLRLVYEEDKITSNLIRPKIFLSEEERNTSKSYLKDNGITSEIPLIMISVLGSEIRKTLPFDYMAKVINEIVATMNANILFNYIPSQEKDAKAIYDLTTKNTQNHIHFNVFGKSLREFIAILSHCDVLIGNEGGAVNMAKALDKPTFTIFSPWIIKKDWNMFEDGVKHDSVHLYDFKPELYGDKTPKEMKNKALELYKSFSTDLIIPSLRSYLNHLKF
ncbi:lipopolysaccharide heptosyltransferase family protein [Aquimarina sp. BL5]|uniref:glycosyltransferase family 9 protein n=1 Tax=Aquimarina sp. BL5 TaxID=1714860 RepID=UPI000E4AE8BE|nr:glycosyltransferase family 9 protein [Aquimarina sp. BL5]AXT50727.1 lipopolysaccharide heptosyltransferase family protein [Aquimarina sp. BL5]RKN08250.1 lipopolysaccharide heptosyltransferase family protein [Aquimarina sp. BL5]